MGVEKNIGNNRNFIVVLFVVFFQLIGWGQTTIFTETIGTVGGTTTIASHESGNGFDNDSYTMSSGSATNPGDIRATSVSSGYTGASGGANVYLTSTSGEYGFSIEGVDASAYTSLSVQFGYRKEAAGALPTLALDYWNGSAYVNVAFSFNEAAGAATGWYLSPSIALPVGAQIATLKIRFVKTSTTAVRIDDVVLTGTIAGCTTPTTQATSSSSNTITGTTANVTFTRGNGDGGVLVVMKSGGAVDTDPTNGVTYTASSTFTSGTQIGTGNYVIYKGTAAGISTASGNIPVSGLTGNTTYHFAVYEYNSASTCFHLTQLTGNFTTLNQITWTGTTSTNWNTGSNWSSGSVPTSSVSVIIPDVTNDPSIAASTTANCASLTVNSGGLLTVNTTTAGGGTLTIAGDVTNNGTISHPGNQIIYMNGVGKTIGGTGVFTDFGIMCDNGSSISLANSIEIYELDIYNNASSSFSVGAYTLVLTEALIQEGVLNLNTGTVEYQGDPSLFTFTDSRFNEGTGTFYYNGLYYSQTIYTGTYYNLKIGTISGNTATIGSTGTVIVSNDFTIINPSTANGIATTAYGVTVANNMYLGNTGNALTLNLGHTIVGVGTFTMGNVSGHVINISYNTNYAISGFSTPTFYGTVNYTGGTQKVITAISYNNITSAAAGTKTMYAALDVNGNLTISAGTLDVGSNYAITLAGDFVRASGGIFTCGTGTVTFDGSATQKINVTAAGGTTPTNSNITFYNLVVDNTDVKMYYDKVNSRYVYFNDFTVNSSKNCYLIGN